MGFIPAYVGEQQRYIPEQKSLTFRFLRS